ncbi:MAG: PD-(D/E)XK nuclease family protein [Prevotella sp.]|nr:PD-(D/E)XK nuclease family protein [Prevotella sp.]
MKSFLEYVAADIIRKYGTDLSHVAIVFPNKRASLFLNEHLARIAMKPLWAPTYITISDLFRQNTKLVVADQITLVCELYKSFVECTGTEETLDHFYGWGELLLSDFDDIDKHIADASVILSNIKDIHELDDISYLTEDQKKALREFFQNMTEDHGTELKKRFLRIWSHLGDIYENFRNRLREKAIAYEGMLYREVATEKSIDCESYDVYLFVGFNVLQKVEEEMFTYLQEENKARFYWDFDEYYMPKKDGIEVNEAGHYVSGYLSMFPNELDVKEGAIYSNFIKSKDITYVSATTEHIQARYISDWLMEKERYKDGKRTAIVLCDESLLPTVLHCLPEGIEKINITTGFPLFQTQIASLVIMLLDMQIKGISQQKGIRVNYLKKVLTHPYTQYISEKRDILLQYLKKSKIYFYTAPKYSDDENMSLLLAEKSGNEELTQWVLDLLKIIAGNSADKENDTLFEEALFRIYTLFNRISELIKSGDLEVDVTTFQKLVLQLINTTSVPFHGEPAEGVQIMGILETRNLDFEHILLLSCNEGNMPKGISDSSFIPYSIRNAYDLTTRDNKVAIYAYYFHSLLQRASDITITYNSAAEAGKSGEMSRFMLQLMVESGFDIKRISLHSELGQANTYPKEVVKDEVIMKILDDMYYMSPTAISRYMRCPLQFYYNNVAKIREPDDSDEQTFDNRIFGNVFHEAAKFIYKDNFDLSKDITQRDIENILTRPELIAMAVDKAIREELFGNIRVSNTTMEYDGLQIINREVIIRYMKNLLAIDKTLAPFRIIGLEVEVDDEITITTSEGKKTVKIGGRIDRLDKAVDKEEGVERMRVIDYKTGGSKLNDYKTVEDIFLIPLGKHADYYLQAMLYSVIVRNKGAYNEQDIAVSPALLFIQHAHEEGYDPVIKIGGNKVLDVRNYQDDYLNNLKAIVHDIFEPAIPFKPAEDITVCPYCPYFNKLCGI